jgi:hypothetical protein
MSCSSIRRNIGIADGSGDYAGLNAAIRGIPPRDGILQTDDFVRTANPSQAADRLRTADRFRTDDRFQTDDHVQAPRSMGTNFGDGA